MIINGLYKWNPDKRVGLKNPNLFIFSLCENQQINDKCQIFFGDLFLCLKPVTFCIKNSEVITKDNFAFLHLKTNNIVAFWEGHVKLLDKSQSSC